MPSTTSTYRHIGTGTSFIQVGDKPVIELRQFGQSVTLPDDFALQAIKGGRALFIPDQKFEELGISSEDLQKYAAPGQQAPEEFRQKQIEAMQALHDLQSTL